MKRTCEHIIDLIIAFFLGQISLDDKKELEVWVTSSDGNHKTFTRLLRICQRLYCAELNDDAEQMCRRMREAMRVNTRLLIRRRLRRLVSYAAMVILVVGVGIFYYLRDIPQKQTQKVSTVNVVPGERFAVLQMPSGEMTVLNEGADNNVEMGKGVVFRKDSVCDLNGVERLPETEEIQYSLIWVPRGGEYNFTLSDGTNVWLNADSKLKFPVAFSGDTREVYLEGEAYFEVTKDSLAPFIVKTHTTTTRVLGTSFSIKAYEDEEVRTTLVEGKVEVKMGEHQTMLKPGQQFVSLKDDFVIRNVDVMAYTSWRYDRFAFDDETLDVLLKQLERWYNIQVTFENPVLKSLRFTGNIPKYEDIQKVLQLIELTTNITFELKDRVLIVREE